MLQQFVNSQYCQHSLTLKELQGSLGGMSNKLVTITSELHRIVTDRFQITFLKWLCLLALCLLGNISKNQGKHNQFFEHVKINFPYEIYVIKTRL